MVRSVLENEEEAQPLAFVGSHKMEDGQTEVVTTLRKLLGVELSEYRGQRDPSTAFNLLRRSVENAEVFVLIKGDLGNYHTAIDTTTFRGFSIADDVAPFIVINDQDAKSAWSFTCCMRWYIFYLGETGVGGSSLGDGNDNERFCDAVAGEYLLPGNELRELHIGGNGDIEAISESIVRLADERNLGRTMVAYNAYRRDESARMSFRGSSQGITKNGEFNGNESVHRLEKKKEAQVSTPCVATDLGSGLWILVRRTISADALSTSKAAKILGVKARQVQVLLGGGG